ncbi:DUF4153 domain-containing protein [Herbidospora sp. RD11066]
MRPLDFLGRIKVKLGIVIVGAVVTAFIVNEVGINGGVPRDLRIAFAVFLALILVQVLAGGMTKPLREMAAAAQTIAKGSYGLRVTATSRDEVGELARAFNAMAADLAEVDRQRRELVANVSHELRTPITGVQAVLENVVDGVSPPEPEILGTALAQTQRLGRLVAQLLDLSRLDSGARPIEMEEFDLADLGGQAVREASLARDDVTVASAIEPGRHLTTADPVLLAQVLANLLDNAVRHSPSGGTVTLTSRASSDGTVEIEVADEGPGIPLDDRQRVFERFSRLDAARAADAGGAGLGLAIAKEIAELHGGTIGVGDGTGCHMVLTLPRAARDLPAAPAARTFAAGRGPTGAVHARFGTRVKSAGRSETDTEVGAVKYPDVRAAAHNGATRVPAETGKTAAASTESTSSVGSHGQTASGASPVGAPTSLGEGTGSPSEFTPGMPAAGSFMTSTPADAQAPRPDTAPEATAGSPAPMPGSPVSPSRAASTTPEDFVTPAVSSAGLAVSATLAEPSAQAESAAPTVSTTQAEPAPSTELTRGAGSASSAEPTLWAEPATLGEVVTSTVSAGSVEPGAQAQSATPDESAQWAESVTAGDPGAPARLAGSIVSAATAEPTTQAEFAPPAEPTRAAESATSGELVTSGTSAGAPLPAALADSTHSTESAIAGEPGAPAQTTASVGSVTPAELVAVASPAMAADPVMSAELGAPAKPAVPADPATPAMHADSVTPANLAAPANPAMSAETVPPAKLGASSQPVASAKVGTPSDPTIPAASVRTAVTSPHPVVASPDSTGRSSAQVAPGHGGPSRPSGRSPYLVDEPPPNRSLGGAILGGVVGAFAGLIGGSMAAAFLGSGSGTETQAAGVFLLLLCVGITIGASLGGRVKAVRDPSSGEFDAYTPPPLFPRPALPDTPRWLLPAATATGLVAAVCFPYAPTGVGVVLTATALTLAVLPAVRHRINAWSVAYSVVAYGLVFVALFRDADWLVGLSLLAAFVVASLAVSGGRGWAGTIRGLLSVGLAVFPVPWFLAGPVRKVLKRRSIVPVLISLGITAFLIALFGVLFISADAVFSSFARDLLSAPAWADTLPVRIFLFAVFAVITAAAILVALRPVAEPRVDYAPLNVARTLWIIPLVGVNLLFALFVGVQVSVLFGGSRRVLETAGLTFAEYARSGFFELITVSVFVLIIVAFCSTMIRGDRWIMATLLGLLCALTLVILASALHRLGLYTAAYGFTRLRASVGATIWWIAAVFVLVLIGGLVKRTRWLPKALVLLTAVSLLVFAVWNPDAQVAETQVSVRGVDRLDEHYLGRLSADAVPWLDKLPEPKRSCVLLQVVGEQGLYAPDPWNGWNVSRQKAAEILAARPIDRSVTCDDDYRSSY